MQTGWGTHTGGATARISSSLSQKPSSSIGTALGFLVGRDEVTAEFTKRPAGLGPFVARFLDTFSLVGIVLTCKHG